MDARKCEVFLQAVDYGSLTVAAEMAGYTQSGVSHVIKSLEDEMGFPLLYRFHTGVAPTEDAKRLLPIMREMAACNSRLEQTAASIRGLNTGCVNVATLSSVSAHWMPRVLQAFREAYPNIEVRVISGGDTEITTWLEQGRADVGVYSMERRSAFEWTPLMEDPYYAILPANHPLAEAKEFPIKAFAGQPFITVPESIHEAPHNLFRQHRIKPAYYYALVDDLTLISMVEMGLGISIMPYLVLHGYLHRNILVLPLAPASARTIGIALRSSKKAAPAVNMFVTYIKQVIGALPLPPQATRTL